MKRRFHFTYFHDLISVKMNSILLVSLVIIGLVQGSPILDDMETEWMKFKEQHGKQYKSIVEENERKAIFSLNYEKIVKHNELYEQGVSTYFMKINERTDWTMNELKKLGGFIHSAIDPESLQKLVFKPKEGVSIPENLDWRTKGAVTGVKDQGECGSGWTFSTVGSVEGQYFLKTGKLVQLSAQNILDCSHHDGNAGCNGGNIVPAYKYIHNNDGIDDESNYPYKAEREGCKYSDDYNVTSLKAYGIIEEGNENDLKAAVATLGPISVAMDSRGYGFHEYGGGIYNYKKCKVADEDLDHTVLVVGYGSENGIDYWLVKNSWGTKWGMKGYFKIVRNRQNQCGIATEATYPIMY